MGGDYGVQKALIDDYLLSLPNKRISSLILPYLYGMNNYLDREELLWARILNNKTIYIPNAGNTWLHFITPREIGTIILLLHSAKTNKTILNVASEYGVITISDFVKTLFDIANKPYQIINVPYLELNLNPRDFFSFRDLDIRLNIRKLREITSWNSDLKIKDELNAMFARLNKRNLVSKWVNSKLFELDKI